MQPLPPVLPALLRMQLRQQQLRVNLLLPSGLRWRLFRQALPLHSCIHTLRWQSFNCIQCAGGPSIGRWRLLRPVLVLEVLSGVLLLQASCTGAQDDRRRQPAPADTTASELSFVLPGHVMHVGGTAAHQERGNSELCVGHLASTATTSCSNLHQCNRHSSVLTQPLARVHPIYNSSPIHTAGHLPGKAGNDPSCLL